MVARWLGRSLVFYLFLFVVVNEFLESPLNFVGNYEGLSLVHLQVGRNCSTVIINSNMRKPAKLNSIPTRVKVMVGLHIVYRTLAVSLVLLANDVSMNPGPANIIPGRRSNSEASDLDFISVDSELFCSSTTGSISDSSVSMESVLHSSFNLGLGDRGLRFGHWNINRMTTEKFDQIKLFLYNEIGKSQVDLLFINETFLNPNIIDSFYVVPGFYIYRRDRPLKSGGGVMAFVNEELNVKRRIDLNNRIWRLFG